MAKLYGVDVSRYQGSIDWGALSREIDFVIIKSGGSDAGRYTDAKFRVNRDGARRAGIPRGFYYFGGGKDGVADAKHFKSAVGKLKKGESIWLDFEVNVKDPIGYCLDFIETATKLFGSQCHFYTNMGRVYQYDFSSLVRAGAGLWGAYWDYKPNTWPNSQEWPFLAIKQYSNSGSVPGIKGAVDLDVFNGSKAQFLKYGKQGIVKRVIKKLAPKPKPKPTAANIYVVRRGDTLGAIAARYHTTVAKLAKNSHISNPNLIFPGQKIYVGTPAPAAVSHVYHTVRKGDTLSAIAGRYKTTVGALVKLNNIKNPNLIFPGQRLRVK
jgi:LysM repeat protein